MSQECDYNQEGFCIASDSGDYPKEYVCEKCSFKEEGAEGLPICIAKPEDLMEFYEECSWCEGPDPQDPDDGPPCPQFAWRFCEHSNWWKPERLSAFTSKMEGKV